MIYRTLLQQLGFRYLLRKRRKSRHSTNLPIAKPPRYKIFLLTWLAIYPLITAIMLVFAQPLNLLPLPIRTLILTGMLVFLMTYYVMPALNRLFHDWLYPKSR